MFLWAVLGFGAGWLINLLGDVLPRRRVLTWSLRCLYCDEARRPAQWIGLLAYLSGQAKCRTCAQRIAWRWPLVELLSAVLFLWLYNLFGFSTQLLLITFYSSILLLICVTDFEHRLILNVVSLPSIIAGLALAFFTPYLRPFNAIIGGVVGFLVTGLIYLGGVWFARRRGLSEVAFGQGDVTLMAFIGFITGIDVLRALVIGVFLGGGVALLMIVGNAVRRRNVLYMPYAYGPYLAAGGWIVLLQLALEKT